MVIVTSAAIVWVTFRVAYPRLRLLYAILADTPLLPGTPVSGLVVRYNWRRVKEPHIVTVAFRNDGARDIERGAFDGSPLRFDIRERVLECLEIKTDPTDQPVPTIMADGSVFVIKPVKINKGACVYVNLLVDGHAPVLSLPEQSLTNVLIRPLPDYGKATTRWLGAAAACVLGFIITTGFESSAKGAAASWLSALALTLLVCGYSAGGVGLYTQNREAWQRVPSPQRQRWRPWRGDQGSPTS